MIKPIDTGERAEVRKRLTKCYKKIAEEEFSSWWNQPEIWPQLESIKEFEEYFDWNHVELIFDLEESEITKEEY